MSKPKLIHIPTQVALLWNLTDWNGSARSLHPESLNWSVSPAQQRPAIYPSAASLLTQGLGHYLLNKYYEYVIPVAL